MLIMSADGKINADHDDEQNKQQDANNYKPILHYIVCLGGICLPALIACLFFGWIAV